MGASRQSQDFSADEACRRDFESLDQLSRLHGRGDAGVEPDTGELNMAAQTPILDPEDQDDFDHLAASGPTADSDDGYADISENEYDYEDVVDDDLHYDSLQKRSPALINPSYFDAVRSPPSQGFGSSSSRYLESSHSNYNLSLDDFEFEDDNFEDIPRQAGGFGPSDFEGSPSHPVLSFGQGSYYNRNDPLIQILDIPMPDPAVLEQLAKAPAREGKDSPFRSYYGYEPVLTDINEDTEPESDSGPRVVSSPPGNRHVKRSRSQCIAKMQSSPFAPPQSPQPEAELKSPTSHRKNSSDSLASNGTEISSSSVFVSARGASGVSSGTNAGDGFLQKSEEDHEYAASSRPMPPFVCVKTPAPFVANDSPIATASPVPLPYDFPDSVQQPLPIAPAERIRLLDDPSFISPGIIPQEYIRFEEPQEEDSPLTSPKPATPEAQTPTPDDDQPRYSDSEESFLDLSQPQTLYQIPVRASSLSATPGSLFNATPRQHDTPLAHGSPYDGTARQDDAPSPTRSTPSKATAVYMTRAKASLVCMTPAAMSSYDALESSVTGVSSDGAVVHGSLDPFADTPAAESHAVVDEGSGSGDGTDEHDTSSNRAMSHLNGLTDTLLTSPLVGVDVALRSATLTGIIAGTNAASVTPGKASRIPLPRPFRAFKGSYNSINEVIDRDFPIGATLGSSGIQRIISNHDILGNQAGVQDNIGSIDDTVLRLTPAKQRKAIRAPKPKPTKTIPRYSLFPNRGAPSRTPSQGSEASTATMPSVDKILTDTSSGSSAKDSVSKDILSLNKPLPVSPGDTSATVTSTRDITPNFPGIPALHRTPAEKAEVARVKRFGSSVKRRLASFWSKSDEALAVQQAADRERRTESAIRLKELAQHMDASTPKRKRNHRTGRFASPAAAADEAKGGEGGEAQVPPSPSLRRVGSESAIMAAMGVGGRRKSVGQNNWVNAA